VKIASAMSMALLAFALLLEDAAGISLPEAAQGASGGRLVGVDGLGPIDPLPHDRREHPRGSAEDGG
jgi:hypothetical protein